MKNTLTVEWPALPIGEPGWRTRLESLAEQAEALIGRDCSLYKTAGLALELVGLMWPVLGAAETVAATCRASLLVGAPGIVAASSAANQLTEVHERLDAIWEAAQNDPAAGMVELPPPVMNEIKPVPYELAEPPAVIEEIEALVDEAAEWVNDQHAQHLAGVADTAPAEDPDELPAPKKRRSKPEPVPPGWWSSDDLADLLSVDSSSVSRWRRAGCLGVDGTDWGKFGRIYAFSAELVADLEANGIKHRLQLVASGLSHCL